MPQFLRIFSLVLMVSAMLIAQDLSTIGAGNSGTLFEDGIIYDQTGNPGTNGSPSQFFPDFLGAGESADDFTVPAGEVWTVDTVYIVGTFSGTGGYVSVDVNIYLDDGPGGMPGTLFYNENVLAAVAGTGPIFTVPLSTPMVLPEGHHWFNFMVNMPFTPEGQFFWSNSNVPQIDSFKVFRDSTDLFGTGSFANWATTEGSTIGGGVEPDLQYAFYGSVGTSGGGTFPEVIYYQFNESGGTQTPNLAVPGSGGAFGILEGDVTMGGTGQFGAALVGSGSNGTINNVNTGWVPDLGTSDWTISLYLNNLPPGTALNYLFGETNTGSNFRCFYSGAAGEFGVLLRTGTLGGTDVTVPGVGPGPSVLTFVYDQTGPTVFSYINGTLVLTTPQAGPLTMTGSGADFFRVGGHNGSTSGGLPVGSLMDEFRFYNRALDAAEVAATWNIQIPVELTSFTASVGGNNVTLDWETATEVNNSGFAIERKSVTSDFAQIGFVAGFGTTTEPKAYTFTDNSLRPGTYSYRLKQIDFDGTFEYSDVIEVEVLTPDVYTLAQNYPNPFNPSTKIAFSLAVDSKVSLKIFDVLGQEVATLVNENLSAGVYNYDFNATGINSGVYFYKIEAVGINGNEFVDIKKMMLLK